MLEPHLTWTTCARPSRPPALVDRLNPAAVAIAMLAGFSLAVSVGSLFFR